MASLIDRTLTLTSDGIAKLVEYLYLFVRNDATIRAIQAENAPRNVLTIQAVVTLTGYTIAGVTTLGPFKVDPAQSDGQRYSFMAVVVETTAGEGRALIDGGAPTATAGLQVPAGGAILGIEGAENIKQFRLTATTATTLPIAVLLFK